MIGTGLALLIGGLAAAGGSAASGFMGANAAGDAASAQAQAAEQAAQLQAQEAQQALDWQKAVYGNNLSLEAPWLQSGKSALANLDNLLGILPPKDLQGAPLGTAAGTSAPGQTITGKGPQYGQDVITQHGIAMKYYASNGPYDIYRPYTADSSIANDQSKWFVNKGGQWTPYSQDLVAQLPAGFGTKGGPTFGAPAGGSTTIPQIPGQNAPLSSYVNPSLGPEGSLAQGFQEKFVAPNGVTEQNDPGFQARLKMGADILQNSAAAKGNLLTGGFAKDLTNYGQDFASNEYNNVYNRAWNEYAQRYNIFNQGQTNLYNRLANLAGMGQTTASTLGYLGQNSANDISSILLNSGAQIGGDIQNAAAARASGYVGGANALGGALSGLGGDLSQYLLLQSLLKNQNQNPTVANSFPT